MCDIAPKKEDSTAIYQKVALYQPIVSFSFLLNPSFKLLYEQRRQR